MENDEPSMSKAQQTRGFLSLLATQFLGATNDNILKGVLTFMVIDGVWSGELGEGGQAIVFMMFTFPFLFFSGIGGPIADKFSKSNLGKQLKFLELPIVCISAWAFWTQNLTLALASLFLLTTQSAFFGPVKYGMIPEIVSRESLARANGVINMTTNIAAILATKLGGWISDRYDPTNAAADTAATAEPRLPGIVLIIVAALGIASALFLPRLSPANRDAKLKGNVFAIYWECVREMKKSPLFVVTLAWGYFYCIATFALLIIPEYAEVLSITRSRAADLLLVLTICIGIGSVAVGQLAGKTLGVRFAPWGAGAMSVFFAALAIVPPTFENVAIFVGGAGLFAGFYIVPLQSLLQHLSPAADRGRFLATANAMSFAFMAVAAIIYKLIRGYFGDAPEHIFAVCAAMMIGGVALFYLRGGAALIAKDRVQE